MRRHAKFRDLGRGLALGVLLAFSSAPATALDALRELPPLFEQHVADIKQRAFAPERILSVRDASNAALAQVALGGDAKVAEDLLRQVFAVQDPETGALPWLLHGGYVKDDNANEFGAQSWGPLLIGFKQRFSPEFQRELEDHARLVLRILAHRIDVNYTNIYLINAVNTLLIGQGLGDEAAAARGRALLEAWRQAVHDHGIAEFSSPTYYVADLHALTAAYRYVKDEQTKKLVQNALDFFWTDLTVSLVNGKMVGAHSRDYDAVHGAGDITVYLGDLNCAKCAWSSAQIIDKVYPYLNALPGGYRPPPGLLALNKLSPRWVTARWGDKPTAVRSLYVDAMAAMGSTAEGNLSTTSKTFAIDLLRPEGDQVTISFIATEHDLGYGQALPAVQGRRRSGRAALNPVIAQYKDWALGRLSVVKSPDPDAQPISVGLILPRYADEIRVNGAPAAGGRRLNGDVDSVFVRVGSSCAALRFLKIDGGQPPEILDDAPNQAKSAMRILWRTDQDKMEIGFLAHAAACGGRSSDQWLAQINAAPLASRGDGAQLSLATETPEHLQLKIGPAAMRARAMNVDAPQFDGTTALSVNGVNYADILYSGWDRRGR